MTYEHNDVQKTTTDLATTFLNRFVASLDNQQSLRAEKYEVNSNPYSNTELAVFRTPDKDGKDGGFITISMTMPRTDL